MTIDDLIAAATDPTPPVELDEAMRALANPVRRQILCWLKDPEANFAGQELPFAVGVCAGRIERKVGLAQSTVSAHLAVLQRAELVLAQKVGQWIFYRRNEVRIAELLSCLQRDL
jgi:ArsR family transcriptional regulator